MLSRFQRNRELAKTINRIPLTMQEAVKPKEKPVKKEEKPKVVKPKKKKPPKKE